MIGFISKGFLFSILYLIGMWFWGFDKSEKSIVKHFLLKFRG